MTSQMTPNPAGDDLPKGGDSGGTRSIFAVLILVLATGLITKLMWSHQPAEPKRIVRIEITKFPGANGSQGVVTARTRTIYVNADSNPQAGASATAKQIQLPGGLWIDCRGNCAEAYRAAQFR